MVELAKYNLAVITAGDELLLLNRFKKPYVGLWNGIGGKRKAAESELAGMIRELAEETGIQVSEAQCSPTGYLEWSVDDNYQATIALFHVDLAKSFGTQYPQRMREGILANFPTAWALDEQNVGLTPDLIPVLPYVLKNEVHRYLTNFSGAQLVEFKIKF
ncbi:NUDIX domain-containing protein [Dellaglioa algida]|uniref:7,8-dihydro-8-oxoguanine triphosphatase n=1 Tax=Dellaglioa algida TaxID=105612 RepID=A0A5C6M880_9LACO|nr:NUDIX domain-containing protein [Dellaglioa algida]MDK1717532.1 NUDIX domain-containing protein [Dellaglioa algida]MDK1720828.1 NUDIX domain-containing protein [Dellaglioa algida]MDK1722497.1 NUDIX domain-containing protein [Dellaglioa algida]MDK1724098.1 NUDIX domain-containing protein [Dellaglioa algida]MDK1725702.1 NUDIX domain-containing protein [Dellaglioa algida]